MLDGNLTTLHFSVCSDWIVWSNSHVHFCEIVCLIPLSESIHESWFGPKEVSSVFVKIESLSSFSRGSLSLKSNNTFRKLQK